MQSGSAYSSWAFSSNALKYAYQLVDKVDCAQSSSTNQQKINQTNDFSHQPNTNSQIMQCLRSKTVEQLLAAQRQIQVPLHLSGFGPTIDGLLVSSNLNQNFNNFNNFLNQHAQQQSHNHTSNHHSNAHQSTNSLYNNISLNNFQSFASFTSPSASTIPLLIGLSRLDMRWNDWYEAIFSSPEDRRNPLILKEKALKGLVKSLYTFHLNVSFKIFY